MLLFQHQGIAMKFIAAAAFVAMSAVPASASSEFADRIAQLIGSEQSCGLAIDQDALNALIEKRVRADDTSFTRSLNTAVWLVQIQVEKFSGAQLSVHCSQVRRVAKSSGLIKP